MARKMKVVPESWYKKILASNSQQDVDLDLEEKLKAEKTNIFGNSTIPDEVKILLLQNLNRQLIDNKRQDDKKPLLVKNAENETATEQPSTVISKPTREVSGATLDVLLNNTTGRGRKILEFLQANGVKITADKVIVNDVTYTLKKMNALLVGLCHGFSAKSTLKSDPSMLNLLQFIKSKSPPADLFPTTVNQFIVKQKGSGLKRKQLKKKTKKQSAWIQKKVHEHRINKLTRKMQKWNPF